MYQANLVTAADISSKDDKSPNAILTGLSWLGHEFLDAAKDDTIWSKAKKTVLKSTAGITFDVLLEWLKAEVKGRIGLD